MIGIILVGNGFLKCLIQVQCGVRLRVVGPRALSLYPQPLAEIQAKSFQGYLISLGDIFIDAKYIKSMGAR